MARTIALINTLHHVNTYSLLTTYTAVLIPNVCF